MLRQFPPAQRAPACRRRTTISVAVGGLSLLGTVAAARAQCQVHLLFHTAGPYLADDRFGYSVAIDGDAAVVGSYQENDCCDAVGRARVFRANGSSWPQQQALFAWDGDADGDLFGYSVAIEADLIAVGARHAYHDGQFPGGVYVFREQPATTTFEPEQKLVPQDAFSEIEFGHAVDISGNLIAVAAPRDDDQGPQSGSVYVFRHDGGSWVQEAKLLAADGAPGDGFGSALAADGERLVIGARGDDDSGADSGSVYVFRDDKTGWVQEAKLMAADGGPQDQFGFSGDISGDTILIGAFRDDDRDYDAGAVYVFRRDGTSWAQSQKLLAKDGYALDHFGVSVALQGSTALVGAQWDDDMGTGSGSVYVFRYDAKVGAWSQSGKLLASNGEPWAEFGISVAISGDNAVVGSWLWGLYGFDRGLGYVFSGMLGFDCNRNGASDACDIFSGKSLDNDSDGVPDECCVWDLNGSGAVEVADMLSLLALWGTDPGGPSDFDGDGDVGVTDLLTLLAHWGACP